MTDTKDLIREIQEHTAAHGGENTATHLLLQAVLALQRQADELAAVGAGGVNGPLMGQRQAMPDLSHLTERGAQVWPGVDAQALREGGAALAAQAPQPTPAHIKAMERAWQWMENQADSQSKGGHATFDLMMLREERDALRAAIDMEVAAATCAHCHGTGEVFGHADNCNDDLCELNGDVHSCAGQIEPCQCASRAALAAQAPQPVGDELGALFREALAWGMTYGHAIPAHQWDDMRESMVAQYVGRAALAAPQPASITGLMKFGGCPECGSRSCVARQCSRTESHKAQVIPGVNWQCSPQANGFAAPQQEVQEPTIVDRKTMELAESVGLIGPASRVHDLHAAIQRFHDLICVNATIKAAQMAAQEVQEPVATQWLAEMIMSDCGCSTQNQRLLDRIIERIVKYERANSAQPAPSGGAGHDIEAAAKALAECMDYPWSHMPEQGRAEMRKHAQAVIDAARKEGK